MRETHWWQGIPSLLLFFGLGLLLITALVGFSRVIYWLALPTGLVFVAAGLAGLLARLAAASRPSAGR